MTNAEIRNDKEKDIIKGNREFTTWYYEKIQKGYQFCLTIDEIEQLIEKIVNWYEFKIPDRAIELKNGTIDSEFRYINDISDIMTVEQLRYRLTQRELKTIDCDYYGTNSYSRPLGGIFRSEGWINYINICIKDKKQSICGMDSYFIGVDVKNGVVKENDLVPIRNYIGIWTDLSLITIESLYEILKKNSNLDLLELEKVLFFHQTDIELRKIIVDAINSELVYSKNTNSECGEIRAKKFSEEFSSYYGIDISFPSATKLNCKNNIKTLVLTKN